MKISITMVSLVAMSGLAFAQAKQADPKAGASATAGAKAGAGTTTTTTTTGAKAGSGSGKYDPGPGGEGTKTALAAGAAAGAKMEMPKPPAEIAAAMKAMGKATKTCVGQGMGMDMAMADMKGTVSIKSDLDGWFLRQTINLTLGKGKTATKMKMEQLSTYDAKLAKWRVMGVSNDGGTMLGTADMKDGKYEFTGEMTSGMGTASFKEHGDMTDPKASKWWGEMSMDKGKTWTKVYEQTCK